MYWAFLDDFEWIKLDLSMTVTQTKSRTGADNIRKQALVSPSFHK